MGTVTASTDVNVPIRTAYNQWTQFESFPRFMEGVEQVQQLDDTHTHWKVHFGPVEREFDATITEQHPDERVAWRSDNGPEHAGVVTFHRIDDRTTRVITQMDIDPEGFVENVGDKLGLLDRRVKGDLKRFKEFIEGQGYESGAWRGEVPRPGSGEIPRPDPGGMPGTTPGGIPPAGPGGYTGPAGGDIPRQGF